MNWLKNLLTHVKGRKGADKYGQLRLARLKEVQKWEASSPDSVHLFYMHPNSYKNWTIIEDYETYKDGHVVWGQRFSDYRIPSWVRRASKRINVRNKGPKFYHKRFVTYKLYYDDYDGVVIFRGIKPSGLVKIESEIRKLRRRGKLV